MKQLIVGLITGFILITSHTDLIGAPRGVWVWSISEQIVDDFIAQDPTMTIWEDFVSFIEAPHGNSAARVSDLYMSTYTMTVFEPERMRAFLAEMNSRGFKVHVVLAEPTYAVPDKYDPDRGNIRKDFERRIDNIIEFQKKGRSNERYTGIMLDIEPHQLNGYPMNFNDSDDFTVIWETYLNDLKYGWDEVQKFNDVYDPDMSFSDAVASWYDDPHDYDGDGIDDILALDVIPYVSFYTVQAYRDTAVLIQAFAAGEMTIAAQYDPPKQCLIGVETKPIDNEGHITFWEEGNDALETALASLETAYADNDTFAGFAIHAYEDSTAELQGYQNLEATEGLKVPLIAITYPNGVPLDGISFSDNFSVTWDVFNPENRAYTVQIAYKKESELNDESIPWHVMHTAADIPASTKSDFVVFDVDAENVSTSISDRLIFRASIAYTGVPDTTTHDSTNYGVGVNEVPDSTAWSDPLSAAQPGYAQAFQMVADSDGGLHGTFYYGYTKDPAPGVYYISSSDGGSNLETTYLTPGTYNAANQKGTWPRKPSIAQGDNVVAVAWIECNAAKTFVEGFTENDKVMYAQFNHNNGDSSAWMQQKIAVTNAFNTIVGLPQVLVDEQGAVHIIWSSQLFDGSIEIQHERFSYDETTATWVRDGVETVASADSSEEILNTPSMHFSNNTLHCAWSSYKKQKVESTPGENVINETFENYTIDVSPNNEPAFNWLVFGSEIQDRRFSGDSANKYVQFTITTSASSSYVSFGLAQKQEWSPVEDLTNAVVSFDIKSTFAQPVANVIAVQIVAARVDSPTTYEAFRLPNEQLKTIPAASDGWQTLTFNVNDLVMNEYGRQPMFSKIKKIEILGLRVVNEFTAVNNKIQIDNFKVQRASSINTTNASMRIMACSKHANVWEDPQVVSTYQYTTEQIVSGAIGEFYRSPLYFPKITSNSSYVYIVWQETTVGTPGITDLAELSDIYFAARDISAPSSQWQTPIRLAENAYAPAISIWNSEIEKILVLYSSGYSEYIAEEAYTGELISRESSDGGASWSTTRFSGASGSAGGIRRPYINNAHSGMHALQIASYPSLCVVENGIMITAWVNGGEHFDGTKSSEAEEIFKVRNFISLPSPRSPFADVVGNNGFFIRWAPPPTSYAPNSYRLRRMADNEPDSIRELNGGNLIYSLSYADNESIEAGKHYRYEVSYEVDGTYSPWSAASNAVAYGSDLPAEDFEYDAYGNLLSGNDVAVTTMNAPMTAVITDADALSGDNALKITFFDNDSTSNKGSITSITFPSVMDLSEYGSIELSMKFNPEPDMIERVVEVTIVEDGSGEAYRVGNEIMLTNDGQWHTYNLFLDQIGGEADATVGAKLDIENIRGINFVTWNNGSTSFFVDAIRLKRRSAQNAILSLSTDEITLSEPIVNQADSTGFMISKQLTPLVLTYGNAPEPWVLRIYTPAEIKNKAGQAHVINKHGLVRYDSDTDTVYPELTMPIKVWCNEFGPDGFQNDAGEIVNEQYAQLGYPPIDNPYFFRGYDFNGSKSLELLPPAVGSFVEGYGDGEYPFDLDGDGFQDGDNYFGTNDNRSIISEEPVWVFVPVMKHESIEPGETAVVMDPDDEETWRVLIDSLKGAGKHTLDLYLSVFLGEDQIRYGAHPHGYGNYSGVIIVDMAYN